MTRNAYPALGTALFGTKWGLNQPQADLMIAVTETAGQRIEFIQYLDPPAKEYHKNPSIAGAAHIAFKVDDIVKERARLVRRRRVPLPHQHLQGDGPARMEVVLLPGSRWYLPGTGRSA